MPADRTSHGARAHLGIEAAGVEQRLDRAVARVELHAASSLELDGESLEDAPRHLGHVLARERREGEHLVEAVEELGGKRAPRGIGDRRLVCRDGLLALAHVRAPCRAEPDTAACGGGGRRQIGADVRREQDDRVGEVDGASASVGEAALVEDAEEALEHVAVRLFDLVEEDHLIGTAAHRLGELTAGVVTDVAGRRANEARDGMRLGILREIETRHRVGGVEEALGDGLGRLGLADAGRSQQEERADRSPRAEARSIATKHVRDALERVGVTDDAVAEQLLEAEQALGVALEQSLLGNASELAHHLGDMLALDVPSAATTRARAGEIEDLHRLVGQRLARQIANAPRDGLGERVLVVRAAVVLLEERSDALDGKERLLRRELAHLDGREAAREPWVTVDDAAVVHLGGGADADDLAASQREAQLARGLVASVLTKQHVHLVEEEDDAALGAGDLRLQLTDPLGERSTHAGAGEHRGRLDAHEYLVLEARHVVVVGDSRREAAHHACLADAGRADQAGVVGVTLGEHVEGALDLGVAPDHGIELAAHGLLREVLTERREQRKLLGVEREPLEPRLRELHGLLGGLLHRLLALALARWRRELRARARARARTRTRTRADERRRQRDRRRGLRVGGLRRGGRRQRRRRGPRRPDRRRDRHDAAGARLRGSRQRRPSRRREAHRELHRRGAQSGYVGPALHERTMRGGAGLLAQREEDVDRASIGAAGTSAASSRELARALDGPADRVGRVVDGHARGLEKDLRIEAPVEQELRGIVATAGERGQQVRRRGLLPPLLREVFSGPPERRKLGLPGR